MGLFRKKSQPLSATERAPRIRLDAHHGEIYFESDAGSAWELLNLSATGALLKTPPTAPDVGEEILGRLNLDSQRVPTTLRCLHQGCPEEWGGAFVGETDSLQALQALIQRHLEAELHSLRMVRVAPQFLKPEMDGLPVWFTAGHRCQLHYVHTPDGQILRWWILVLGLRAEWSCNKGLRTGTLEHRLSDEHRFREDSSFDMEDPRPNASGVNLIRRVIASVERLNEAHREALLATLALTKRES